MRPVHDDGAGIAAIVLAAGLSTRWGGDQKVLTPVHGRPMVCRVVEVARAAGLLPVVVVTGHEGEGVARALGDAEVTLVRNPQPNAGISRSVRCGVQALPAGVSAAVILLGDMPWVTARSVRAIADAWKPEAGRTIVVPRVDGRRGNPVLWGAEHFEELVDLEGDVGARTLLERYPDRVHWLDLPDAGVLRDLDRPEELDAPRAGPRVRPATLDDLAALMSLEASSFETDRTNRRSMRHLLQRAHAAVLVAVDPDGALTGSVVLLFSRGTATVRIYSIAVHPRARGQGVARHLVEAAEVEAWRRERAWVRLEIRRDNRASIGLFESLGYRRFGSIADYYADHMEALRYEKAVDAGLRPALARVPYYRQTLDFTCGPAALMMAFASLDAGYRPDRVAELRLWREATTVFMTSGHGGCGPYGLALAAWRRGWAVELHLSGEGAHLLESVRSADKREVMALVQADMEHQVAAAGIPVRFGKISPGSLEQRARDGAVPVVLISSWAIYGTRVPHWVVVTGFDQHFVYAHDPFIDEEEGETPADSINMPIGRSQFERMARYGRRGLQAALFIGPHRHTEVTDG